MLTEDSRHLSSRLGRAGVVALLLLAGCETFPTPAELQKPTVIAVVATPPIARLGETSSLQIVMVDENGPLQPSDVTWTLRPTYSGYETIGTLEPGDVGEAVYRAPATLPELPANALPLDTLAIEVSGGGATIDVIKLMGVADLESSNPEVELLADGAPVIDELTVTRDGTFVLSLVEAPDAGDDARYAWYSTFGTIEKYQSNPTEIEIDADEDVTEGWLHAVYRDGRGGVAWRSVRLVLAP
ncbi:MAG: hypothetical protein IPL79_00415 [Myxococcales bacterium]|nr:hypothetical protein [Myxococcales bacterium]